MMTTLHIPRVRVDPVPLPLRTSEPSSFARNTFLVRIPRIIDGTIAENNFPPAMGDALRDLRAEILQGAIQPLREDAPDCKFWNAISRDYIGRSWLDVPWFWAETFFYRRVLEATRYFQPGEWQRVDPYRTKKLGELETAPRALSASLAALPDDLRARFERLWHAALWGNRTDLSYNVAANIEKGTHDAERENILVDDTGRVWEHLRGARRIAYIADNAGTELLNDLALVDFLLEENVAREIVLHLKPQPFFVSDAMPGDVEMALAALTRGDEPAQSLARRLRGYVDSPRLKMATHWFYPTCLHYFQLPDDLFQQLATFDLVILKGDANYRRLLGDAHWATTASFEQATAYFPAPLVSLRTLKAEIVVGLKPGQAEQLQLHDPDWLVNGKRGVIQANFVKKVG